VRGVGLPEIDGRLPVGEFPGLDLPGRALRSIQSLLQLVLVEDEELAAGDLGRVEAPPSNPPGDRGHEEARLRLEGRAAGEPGEDEAGQVAHPHRDHRPDHAVPHESYPVQVEVAARLLLPGPADTRLFQAATLFLRDPPHGR
jgi:hypothetical protein